MSKEVALCEKRDTVVVSFFDVPDINNIVENCTGNSFTVSFEIDGIVPYTVNGEQIVGNILCFGYIQFR